MRPKASRVLAYARPSLKASSAFTWHLMQTSNALPLELLHHVFETLVLFAQKVGCGDPAILKKQLGRVLHVVAHLLQFSAPGKTGRILVHQDKG